MTQNTITEETSLGEVTFQEYEPHDLVNKRTNLSIRPTLTSSFLLTYTIQGEYLSGIFNYSVADELVEEEELNDMIRMRFADMLSQVMGIPVNSILPNVELSFSDNSNLDVKIAFNMDYSLESRGLPFLRLVKTLEPITSRLKDFDSSPEKDTFFQHVKFVKQESSSVKYATGIWVIDNI